MIAENGLPLSYFALTGPDNHWVWATAKIKGTRITVWSQDVKNPIKVRYAWADNPAAANLCNKEGLPACPFEMDVQE